MTYTLILLRHGESDWNAKNLFTGWVDVDLTEKGRAEAVRGGELLVEVLPHLDLAALRHVEPTWVVGFSDAAHADGGMSLASVSPSARGGRSRSPSRPAACSGGAGW